MGNVRDSDCNNNSDVLSAATFMLKMLIPPVNPATAIDGASSEEVVVESPLPAPRAVAPTSGEIRGKRGRKTKRSDDDEGERKPAKKAKIELSQSGEGSSRSEDGWDRRRDELEELEKVKEILKQSLGSVALGAQSASSIVPPEIVAESAPADEDSMDSIEFERDTESVNLGPGFHERPLEIKFSTEFAPTSISYIPIEPLTSSVEYNGGVDAMRCELMLRTLDETSEADHFVPLEAVLPSEATSMGLPWNISGRYDWSPRSSMTEQDDSYDSEDDLDDIDWSREWENL
jgi:hypothetical protein